MKDIYYYIDEAGTLDKNDSKYFILGCYMTDAPESLRNEIESLYENILNSPYFAMKRQDFMKQGFHACKNHPDIRSRFYELIAVLNVRAYILLIDKSSKYFDELILNKVDIYKFLIEKLFYDRLLKTKKDFNYLIFEQYGSKVHNWESTVSESIKNVVNTIYIEGFSDIKYEISIKDKSEKLLSIVDYINYIFVQIFEEKQFIEQMKIYFRIIEPKIALINKVDKNEFFSRKNRMKSFKY